MEQRQVKIYTLPNFSPYQIVGFSYFESIPKIIIRYQDSRQTAISIKEHKDHSKLFSLEALFPEPSKEVLDCHPSFQSKQGILSLNNFRRSQKI